MLTRTAGIELAKHQILVIGVGPGAVATPINLATMKDPALMTKLDTAIPLGRMATPEEIAAVVAFLAGPKSELHERDNRLRRWRHHAPKLGIVEPMSSSSRDF